MGQFTLGDLSNKLMVHQPVFRFGDKDAVHVSYFVDANSLIVKEEDYSNWAKWTDATARKIAKVSHAGLSKLLKAGQIALDRKERSSGQFCLGRLRRLDGGLWPMVRAVDRP